MRTRLLFLCLGMLLFLQGQSLAQVIELRGGDSTMFHAGGGSVILHFPSSTETFGAGFAAGQFRWGVSSKFDRRNWNVTVGDNYIGLPVGAGLAVPLRGVTVERKWKMQKLTLFTGAAGQVYTFPYFSATTVHNFGTGILFQRKLTHTVDFSTMGVVVGSKYTAVGALHYAGKTIDATGAAGLLQGQRFGNGTFTFRPIRSLAFFASHQVFLFDMRRPLGSGTGHTIVQESTTITSAGVSVAVHGIAFGASALTGTAGKTDVSGQTFGVSIHPSFLTIAANYYRSPRADTATSTFTERLNRRWSVSEFLSYSKGQWSVNYGGSFTSNRLTASVGYATNFLPYTSGVSPFQQTIIVNVSLQLPHSTAVTLATSTLPNGQVQWSTYGSSYLQGPLDGGNSPGQSHGGQGSLNAKFIVRGLVKDSSGKPVSGAAVLVGKETAFTDSDGSFFVRFRRKNVVSIKVVPADFRAPGNWHVNRAPASATPQLNDNATAINIEVAQGA